MKITHNAIVKGGNIIYDNIGAFYDDISFFDNELVIVTIQAVSATTWHQHKGYRGIILPQVLDAIESEGLFRFPEEYAKRQKLNAVHHFLKRMFLNTMIDTKVGKFEFETSTSQLAKNEVEHYWESIAKWYSETFFKELHMPEKQEEK